MIIGDLKPDDSDIAKQVEMCAKIIGDSSTHARNNGIPPDVFLRELMYFLSTSLKAVFKDKWEEVFLEIIKDNIEEIERNENARN